MHFFWQLKIQIKHFLFMNNISRLLKFQVIFTSLPSMFLFCTWEIRVDHEIQPLADLQSYSCKQPCNLQSTIQCLFIISCKEFVYGSWHRWCIFSNFEEWHVPSVIIATYVLLFIQYHQCQPADKLLKGLLLPYPFFHVHQYLQSSKQTQQQQWVRRPFLSLVFFI